MIRILIAPNSFKNALTAEEASKAIASGLKDSGLGAELISFPIADGGDQTSSLLVKHLKGSMKRAEVYGAYLKKTSVSYGLINRGKTAVIEIAETSGFKSIQNRLKSPLKSSSKGLGELICKNMEAGIHDFIICLGGSVTVDGGIGMLQELGLKFKDSHNKEFKAMPDSFNQVESMDISALQKIRSLCSFTVLCDVDNKLLGKKGAAHVFGPQKGANEQDVDKLESFLKLFTALTKKTIGKSLNNVVGGGAAGGLGAAFEVFLNAKLKPGASTFCELSNFEDELKRADLLITGEGSIDSQSLNGKGPVEVARLARKNKIPCIALAGKIPLTINSDLQELFMMLLSIGSKPEKLDEAIANTKGNLKRTGKQVGNLLNQLCYVKN